MAEISELEALEMLRRLEPSGVELARRFQVSQAFVSLVLTGKRGIPAHWLEAVGVQRKKKITYHIQGPKR